MTPATIAALLRLQTPLALCQQQREAADAALRQAIEAAGFDLGVLEAAHEEHTPIPLPIFDSGLSAEPDAACAGCADKQATIDAAKIHADTYLASNADLTSRNAALNEALNRSLLRNLSRRDRTLRLVAIARTLRDDRDALSRSAASLTVWATNTEKERDRLRAEAETAHANEDRLNKALRQSEDLVSIRTGQRDDAMAELAEARAKLETVQSEGLRLAGYLDRLYPNGWSSEDFEGEALPLPTAFAPAESSPAVEPEPVAPAPEPEPVAAPVAMCPGFDSAGCPHELPVAFPISGLCRRCQGKKNRASQPSKPAPKPAPTPQPKAVTPASTTGAFTIDAGGVPHTSTSILACVRTAMHKRAWFRLAIDENGPVALALGKGGDAWLKPLCDITPEETGWCCTVPPIGVTRHPAADRVTKWLDGIVGKAARRSND